MYFDHKIWIGDANGQKVCIEPKMANRHGLIAGATGTGKTITLKVLAESFSDAGVPVFLADVKGDLSGMCKPGADNENMQKRIAQFGLAECGFNYQKYPTVFWDIFGNKGIPLRTTISEMGPLMLSRLMELTDTQSDILSIVFKIADDQNLLLIDTKDLKAMLQHISENNKDYADDYGNISKQSVGAILRNLVALEAEGAEDFFGEPALNIADWFQADISGKGTINVLDCQSLINSPTMYATFLLWLMSELFEELPEVGDMDKPRMVFFFDEAHLLFNDISKALQDKIEQVVKLIRSKGVGIYFITQSPKDIPDTVLSQLGNKIQHALRAYTPSDEKAVKAAANAFRANPDFDTKEILTALGTGEALISVLDAEGVPGIVQNCNILPPQSQMGPISDEDRQQEINACRLSLFYKNEIDSDSAYEFFQRRSKEQATQIAAEDFDEVYEEERPAKRKTSTSRSASKSSSSKRKTSSRSSSRSNSAANRAARSAGSSLGREIGKAIGKQIGGSAGKNIGGNVGASLGRSILGNLLKF